MKLKIKAHPAGLHGECVGCGKPIALELPKVASAALLAVNGAEFEVETLHVCCDACKLVLLGAL